MPNDLSPRMRRHNGCATRRSGQQHNRPEMREGILTGRSVRRRPRGRPRLRLEVHTDDRREVRGNRVELTQSARFARRQREVHRVWLAMIHAAVVLIPTAGACIIAALRQRHVAIFGIMRMVMRVRRVAVPVGVRVVVMLFAVRMHAPLGQPEASQADRTDAQPKPQVAHAGGNSRGFGPLPPVTPAAGCEASSSRLGRSAGRARNMSIVGHAAANSIQRATGSRSRAHHVA